jgi:hypothetical protein
VGIGRWRLFEIDESSMMFCWRDRAHGDRARKMKLSCVEFLRGFLLHVLPRGFARSRHYGQLGNRKRATKLAVCRLQLGAPMPVAAVSTVTPCDVADDRCPSCRSGNLVRRPWSLTRLPEVADTS